MTTDYPTEPCRSCGALVIWALTERLRPMPVDAEPTPDGSVALTPRPDQQPTALVLPVARRFGRRDLRKSHFSSCPDSAKWRSRDRRVTS